MRGVIDAACRRKAPPGNQGDTHEGVKSAEGKSFTAAEG